MNSEVGGVLENESTGMAVAMLGPVQKNQCAYRRQSQLLGPSVTTVRAGGSQNCWATGYNSSRHGTLCVHKKQHVRRAQGSAQKLS